MRLPVRIANPCLAVLIEYSGYRSLDEFASAVSDLGWRRHGLQLSYDHTTVKRWLAGGVCQQPDLVAEVLSNSWGVAIPVSVIWPQLRAGGPPVPAHLLPCVAARTLEELATYIGSDMLTRRQMLADAVHLVSGAALTDPLLHWLSAPAVGIAATAEGRPGRVGLGAVQGIEAAIAQFATQDAVVGGGLSREAGVGQLKYAVDLLRDGTYTDEVGNRLLAAVAELAGMVGWMSHDVDMNGPAQRYLVLGLQAARESTDPRALLLRISLLADLARQMRAVDQPATGLRLVETALDLLPRGQYPAVAAMLWNLKARMLAPMGADSVAEMRHAIALSFDLLAQADTRDCEEVIAYTGVAELSGNAAICFQEAAACLPDLAFQAERYALDALAQRPDGFTRSTVFDHISLVNARFTLGEADQAAADGHDTLGLASEVAASCRVLGRLRTVLDHSTPYANRPAVRDFRDRLIAHLSAT